MIYPSLKRKCAPNPGWFIAKKGMVYEFAANTLNTTNLPSDLPPDGLLQLSPVLAGVGGDGRVAISTKETVVKTRSLLGD